ncbi:MAG: chromate efflux transporter [Gammaproteobacteria bacterium]|nr:chromate efflux transporter [Gammaproteobacteria bacterium]
MSPPVKQLTQNDGILEVFITFLTLGLTSFGGPIAHLGYFRNALVTQKQWVTENQFSQLLALCQFLPGPASSQLGFALGLLRAGWPGAITAFVAFTLPSVLLLVGFAALLPALSNPIGEAAVHGLKLVAFIIVTDAILNMAKTLCPDTTRRTLAALITSMVLLADTAWFQIVAVAIGGIAGLLLCREPTSVGKASIRIFYSKHLGGILLGLFFFILIALPLTQPFLPELFSIAESFYRAGALVFGGGHVVLPLLEETIVQPGWVSKEDFLAGYGAAQMIPGPMFAFSAYLGALIPTETSPWWGATVAFSFMFLPGFLLISGILPFWQRLSQFTTANYAIAGINAAVVGLLGAALYDPIFIAAIRSGTDLVISIMGLVMLRLWRLSPLIVIAGSLAATLFSVLF